MPFPLIPAIGGVARGIAGLFKKGGAKNASASLTSGGAPAPKIGTGGFLSGLFGGGKKRAQQAQAQAQIEIEKIKAQQAMQNAQRSSDLSKIVAVIAGLGFLGWILTLLINGRKRGRK